MIDIHVRRECERGGGRSTRRKEGRKEDRALTYNIMPRANWQMRRKCSSWKVFSIVKI